MADSMPPMLREEAFHLAAGVVPMRRWAQRAGKDDVFLSMATLQESVNKWFPRALEMFGDERGGDTNIKFGFKDLKNREAQDQYIDEVTRMMHDINSRFLRARFPGDAPDAIERALEGLESRRESYHGVAWTDLVRLPDRRFFRRKGESAWQMIGIDGETFTDVDAWLHYLARHLNSGYMASRDLKMYADVLRKVAAGELKPEEASKRMPRLKRVGGACPCSKSVRWVVD